MKAPDNNKKRVLARQLRKDLSDDRLVSYIEENRRMVKNEIKMGRKHTKYQNYVNAGILALLLPKVN